MTPPLDAQIDELLQLTQRLLDSIATGDWNTYQELCDPLLTAFEPEAVGQLVQGLPFHEFYFQLGGGARGPHLTTLCAPHVRIIGDVGLVCYIRLNQRVAGTGAYTAAFEETRVWQRQNGQWKHIHFHRSPIRVRE